MGLIKCEICGSPDILKDDGRYVCQNCGVKYSVDEARKLLFVHSRRKPVDLNKTRKKVKEFYRSKNYVQAESLADQLLQLKEKSPDLIMYRALSQGWQNMGNIESCSMIAKESLRAIRIAKENFSLEKYFSFCTRFLGETIIFCLAVEEKYKTEYDNFVDKLDSSYTATIEKARSILQKGVGEAWLLMDGFAREVVDKIDNIHGMDEYFWELVDAIVDDLNINEKRGTVNLALDPDKERIFFTKIRRKK